MRKDIFSDPFFDDSSNNDPENDDVTLYDLDDHDALAVADPGQMLLGAATAGAQMRYAWAMAWENTTAHTRLQMFQRPRALVICAVGGSAHAGDLLSAVIGFETSVPVQVVRSSALPGWVGPLDVVCVVSCSGRTRETLAAAYEAQRRGCQLVGVGAPESPLAQVVQGTSGGCFFPVNQPNTVTSVAQGSPESGVAAFPPRMMLWALATPLLLVAHTLGLTKVNQLLIEQAAARLDDTAVLCGPASSWALNPAKEVALALRGCLPLVWGAGEVGRALGRRFVGLLAENAKRPAVYAAFPEAGHGLVVALDGQYGIGHPVRALSVVLVRDGQEPPHVAAMAEAASALAQQRQVPVSAVQGEGEHPLLRAAQVALTLDFASLYAAFAAGVNPLPIVALEQVKDAVAARGLA